MIIHLDTDNPKSLEQKVQDLILKKLYIKVKEEQVFIDKAEFVKLILPDIIVLAKTDFDVNAALILALKTQKEYRNNPDMKKEQLAEAAEEFENEIVAYQYFLDADLNEVSEDELYLEVLSILNSEHELLTKKLHNIIMDSLGRKLSEEDAKAIRFDRWTLLDNFANYVRFIASNPTIDDAVQEMEFEMEMNPDKFIVLKESIKKELTRIAPLAKEEIDTYKLALSFRDQNAEFPMILAMVKQLLNLED